MNPRPTFRLNSGDIFPILSDREKLRGCRRTLFPSGPMGCEENRERMPQKHIDIGSRIDGFITHLLVFMPVTVVDIRPLKSTVDGLTFFRTTQPSLPVCHGECRFPFQSPRSGTFWTWALFRPYRPDACFKFMRALERVLAPGGRLYFSVPCGRERGWSSTRIGCSRRRPYWKVSGP